MDCSALEKSIEQPRCKHEHKIIDNMLTCYTFMVFGDKKGPAMVFQTAPDYENL